MGLIFSILKAIGESNNNSNQNNRSTRFERNMNSYGLSELQKKEVKKGNYKSYNFEEDEDKDDGDYYFEYNN